jgi:16S rRNA (guanine527-N7)-methyltransferase
VSSATLSSIWRRHVADCAQAVPLMPAARRWVDMGSGAGLPGLVIAIVGGEGTHVDLIESNRRKCAFLRQAIMATGAPATVHAGRAEDLLPGWRTPVDVITARAVAPLARLFELAAPLMTKGTPAAFFKGRDFEREIAEATQSWDFDLVKHDSRIGEGGVILEVSRLRRKRRGG